MAKFMVLIRPFHNYRGMPDATVYVKERSFFEDQGGTTQAWGKTWEEVEVPDNLDTGQAIEAAREIGRKTGLERAKELP